MPVGGPGLVLLTLAAIALLLFLILVVKLHAFLALLMSSMALGLAAGMGPEKVLKSIQAGFGDALGFIAVVVGLGAMIGRFLEHSGGGRALADWLLAKFGRDRAVWAVLTAAFLVGLPIFFEVGFIILVAAGLEPGARIEALAALLRHADVPPPSRSRTRWCRRIPAPAAAAQLLGRGPRPHDSLRRRRRRSPWPSSAALSTAAGSSKRHVHPRAGDGLRASRDDQGSSRRRPRFRW